MYPTRQNSIIANLGQAILREGKRIDNHDISELEKYILDEKGHLRLLAAKDLLSFGFDRLRVFAHHYGVYQFPTVELFEVLKSVITDFDKCIEIGAGRGDVGRLLGIRMTDSHLQARKEVAELYAQTGQPIIKYPNDVLKLDYKDALKKYRPKTVLGCWVTHKYNAQFHQAGGNMYGIDSDLVLKRVERFVFVGNLITHRHWRVPNMSEQNTYFREGIISRSDNHAANFVAVITKLRTPSV